MADDDLDFLPAESLSAQAGLQQVELSPAPTVHPNTSIHMVETKQSAELTSVEGFAQAVRQSKHPGVTLSHLIFKAAALFFYLGAGLISNDYIVVCVICILCLAFDFWTVRSSSAFLRPLPYL